MSGGTSESDPTVILKEFLGRTGTRELRMPTPRPVRLDLVYAEWCPHSYPVSSERAPKLAARLGVPLRILDIDDKEQERVADRLVEAHGDWTEDYLIPQLFLEWSDGRIQHLLTGSPSGLSDTRTSWEKLLALDPTQVGSTEAFR